MAHRLIVALMAVAIASLALVTGVRVDAHEMGTSHVAMTVDRFGRYELELTTDAAALLARLEALTGQPRSTGVARDEYAARITALASTLLEHMDLRFGPQSDLRDNLESGPSSPPSLGQPQFVSASIAATASATTATMTTNYQSATSTVGALADMEQALRPPTIAVRLHGLVPRGATTVTWRYDLARASYAFIVKSAGDDPERVVWLEGGEASPAIAFTSDRNAAPSRASLAWTYLQLGFTHILPGGIDHILFVLGLFLLSRRLQTMLWQVSAFTLAHSITLGLAMYGVVSLPSAVVEPLIALSIVYVAFENVWSSELKRSRIALVFAFGLLHGLGFAGVLRELALPPSEFLTGLLSFNVGVEAGQLTVIALASLLVARWTVNPNRYRQFVVIPASVLIALVGVFWTVTRLLPTA